MVKLQRACTTCDRPMACVMRKVVESTEWFAWRCMRCGKSELTDKFGKVKPALAE